jgi:hypothetical protein
VYRLGLKEFNMYHIQKYQNFINEETGDPNKRFEIIDAIRDTDTGKLLQRILGVNPTLQNRTFDHIFKPVKTGRVYIGGNYGGKPRIYYNNGRWCQESESSGHIYGQGCAGTLEGIIQFSVIRYVLTNLERGINKDDITRWINSNWNILYNLSSVKEILDSYKKETGMEAMITDLSIIPSLPNYKKYEKFLGFTWNGYSLMIDMNPFKIDGVNMYNVDKYPVSIKLSNKKKYSASSTGRKWDVTVDIGAETLEELDRRFLQGLKYSIKKWYELASKRSGANVDNLEISKILIFSMIEGNGNDDYLYNAFIDLYNTNPLRFSSVVDLLKDTNPGVWNRLSLSLGDKGIENIKKGSSVLNRYKNFQ